jgi:predicted phosphoribosyltransferase
MRFKNRGEAAKQLVGRLIAYKGQNPLILGVPRGAVPMARIIADALGGELDVVLVRKLRAPGQPELAIGAVDEAGTVLKGRYIHVADEEYLRDEIQTQQDVMRARRAMYTKAQKAIDPAGRIVVIVDDGIATGSSMLAAIRSVRARKPQKLIVAIGVAPPQSLSSIAQHEGVRVDAWIDRGPRGMWPALLDARSDRWHQRISARRARGPTCPTPLSWESFAD